MTDAWFRLMATLSGYISRKKASLVEKNIFQSILGLFFILFLEVFLGILALPIYLFFDFKKFPKFFNQTGCSYSLYRMRRRVSVSVGVPLLSVLFTWVILSNFVFAATYTWDGGGGDGLWSTCTNWSSDLCPGGSDYAQFNSGSDSVSIDSNISVLGIDIDSGYSGTITQASGVTVTVGSGTYNQAGGTFVGGDSAIDVNGQFIQTAGTFTATSATTTVSSHLTLTGGTFYPNGGVVEMDGTSAAYVDLPGSDSDTSGDLSLYSFSINKSSSGYVYMGNLDWLVVTNTLYLTDGYIYGQYGGNTVIEAEVCENLSYSVNFTNASNNGQLRVSGGTGTLTLPNGAQLPAFTLDASSCTLDLTGPGTTTFNGASAFTSGTINGNTAAIDFNNTFTLNGGTWNGGVGTENFDNTVTMSSGSWDSSTGGVTAGSSAAFTVSGATVDMQGVGTADFNNNFTLSSGTFDAPSGTMYLDDHFYPTGGTFNHNSGVVEMDGSSASLVDLPGSSSDGADLTLSSFSVNKSSSGYIYMNNNDYLSTTGTLSLLDGYVYRQYATGILETLNCSAVTFNTNFTGGDAWLYVTGGSGTMTVPNGQVLPAFYLNDADCTVDLTGPGTTRVDYTLQLTSGVMNGNGAALDVDYTTLLNGGTWNGGAGTENFDNAVTMSSGSWDSGTGAVVAGSSAAFTVSGASVDMQGVGTADFNNNFTLSSGTFDAPSGTMYLDDHFYPTGGTFNHNSGVVEMDGSSASLVDLPGASSDGSDMTIGNFTINKSSSGYVYLNNNDYLSVTGTMNLSDGYIYRQYATGILETLNCSAVNFNTNFTGGDAWLYVTGGSGTMTIPNGQVLPAFYLADPDCTVDLTGPGTTRFDYALQITTGTMNANTAALDVDYTTTLNGGTWNGGVGTENFDNTVTMSSGSWDSSTGAVTAGSSAAFTVSGATVDMQGVVSADFNNNFTLSSGTFDAPSGTMYLDDHFSPTGGTFNHNGGTVEMDGSGGNYIDLPGSTNDGADLTFANFTINKSSTGYVYMNNNDYLSATGTVSLLDGYIYRQYSAGIIETLNCSAVTFNTNFTGGDGWLYVTGGSGTMTVPNGQVMPAFYLADPDCTVDLTGPATTRFDYALQITTGTMNANTAALDVDYTTTLNGGTWNGGVGTENFDNTVTMSSGSWDSSTGAVTAGSSAAFTVSGATVDMQGVGTADFNNNFTLSSGTFDAPSGTMYLDDHFYPTGGTFNHNSGVVEMDGSGGNIIDLPGADNDTNSDFTLSGFNVNKSSTGYVYLNNLDILTVTGTFQMLDGYLYQQYGGNTYYEAQGDLFQSSAFTGNSAQNVYINGSANQTFSGNATSGSGDLPPITINKTGGTLTFGSGSNTTMRGSANFTYVDGTVIPASSTFYFVGTMNLDGEATSGTRMRFDDVHFDSGTVTLTGELEVEGNLNIGGGTLTTGGNDMWIAGDWNLSSGTFTHGSNTTTFDGANQSLTGATTFNNFVKTTTTADTFTFPASVTTTFAGSMTLQGAVGQLLTIQSSSGGTQAKIDPQGTRTISYLSVSDNNNVNATAIETDTFNITHGGNLTNWSFTVSLQFTSASATGSESVTTVNIPVSIDLSVGEVTADYTITGGTMDPSDFTLENGTVTIGVGNTTTSITLTITDDGIFERAETILLTLSNVSGANLGGNTTYTYTVTDDDTPIVDLTTAGTFTQSDWSSGVGTNTTTQFATSTAMTASTSGQFGLQGGVASNWYDSNWLYRRQITIANGQVSADLSNFPVLITEANLSGTSFFSNVKSDGTDIVFTSSDGTTKLSREVVSINTGSETLEAWVNVPSVSGSVDTDIYIYYGYSGASETNDTSTWDSNFEMVHHMNEDPSGSAPTHQDSTSNNNDGTVSGATSAGDLVSAQIGNGLEFDGSGDSVNFGNDAGMNTTGDMSFSLWYRWDDSSNYQGILVRGGYAYLAAIDSGDRMAWYRSGWQAGNTLTSGTTYHLYWVVESGTLRYYIDGVAAGTDTAGTGSNSPSNDTIMGTWASSYWMDGVADEARFSSSVRSADWIATEYNNQNAPGSFYSVGSEEPGTTMGSTGSLTSAIFNTGTTTHQWGVVQYTTDIGVTTTVKIRTATSSDMSSATAWGSCSPITNGADISGNSCVTDGQQYLEYQVTLNQINSTSSIFQEISIQYLNTSTLTIAENALGTVSITATIPTSTTSTVSVPFTLSGTASNPGDHDLATTGTITISPGSLTGVQTFDVVADSSFESDETVIVSMGSPTNATPGVNTIYNLTIANDDTVNVPSAPTVVATSTTALNLVINQNSNPASTEYQVCQTTDTTSCESAGYLQADGTLTSSSSVFQTYANWGGASGIDVTGLTTNTAYQFLVQAQDGGSTTTLSSANAAVYTLAPPVHTVGISDATVTTTYQLQLSWTDTGQNGMRIERDGSCDDTYTTIYDNSSSNETTPTTTATNLVANTCYQFRFASYNAGGVLNTTTMVTSSQITTPPAQPTGLSTLSVDTDQIIWQWSAVTGATSYNIYDSINGGLLGNTASTNYLQTVDGNGAAIQSSATYGVIVRAVNSNGTGIASSEATATADPSAPSNLGHSANTTSTITWTWTGDASSTFYARDANNVLDSTGGFVTATTWLQSSLSANTSYTMEVRAQNQAAQNSSYVSIARYTSQNQPDALTFSSVTANSIIATASGTFPNLGTASAVLRFSNGAGATQDITSGQAWTNSSLTPNTQYTYGVAATNGDGDKSATTTASQYTLAATPGQITTTIGSTTGTLTLTLNANSNPTGSDVRIYETITGAYVDNSANTLTGDATDFDTFGNWGTVTVSGLSPNTAYQFTSVVRNADLILTSSSTDSTAVYTRAYVPSSFNASAVAPTQVTVTWGANGNPAGTEYFAEDSGNTSNNSGWTTAQSYTFTNLTPGTTYNFQIKARNGDGIETNYLTASGVQTNSSGNLGNVELPELPAGSQRSQDVAEQQTRRAEEAHQNQQRAQQNRPRQETRSGGSGSAGSYRYRSTANESSATVTIEEGSASEGSVSFHMRDFVKELLKRLLRVATQTRTVHAIYEEIQSVTVHIKKGETEEVDINGDRIIDVRVTYLGLVNGEPQYNFTYLTNTHEWETAVTINGGSYETSSRIVVLFLHVKNAKEVAISNSDNFSDETFIPYQSVIPWTLSEGEGEKNVYVRFKTEGGGTAVAMDSITLVSEESEALVDDSSAVVTIDASCLLQRDRVYKGSITGKLVYITPDCTKKLFPSMKVYYSYFDTLDTIQKTQPVVLDSIPLDKNPTMTYGPKHKIRSGSFIKNTSSPNVYMLIGDKIHWIVSEAVFTGLQFSWNWIETISDDQFVQYAHNGVITTSTLPDEILVSYTDSPEVYQLVRDTVNTSTQRKRKISHPTEVDQIGYEPGRIAHISSDLQFEDGEDIVLTPPKVVPDKKEIVPTQFTRDLKKGDRGKDVKKLQGILRKLGHFNHPQDTHYFGEVTKKAVAAYQKQQGLSASGELDLPTRIALEDQ